MGKKMIQPQIGAGKTSDMPSGCRICARAQGEIAVALVGDIDHHRAAELRAYLDEIILQERPRSLFVDLSGIDFMDSSGLGLIMGRYTLLGRLGGQLILEHPSEAAKRMIALAAMERFIRIVY